MASALLLEKQFRVSAMGLKAFSIPTGLLLERRCVSTVLMQRQHP
jgi:hypothetical protein